MRRRAASLLVLALAAYLATGVYQVRPGELAVVRRCGRVLDEPRRPGLNVGLPWGLDRVDRVAVDRQHQMVIGFLAGDEGSEETGDAPAGEVLTGDQNLLDVRLTVQYRVDPAAVTVYVLNTDRLDGVLERAAEEALAATLAGEPVAQVLLGRSPQLETRLQGRLQRGAGVAELGVLIDGVSITYAQPPAELVDVFRDVNRARTQKAIAEREAQADAQAAAARARAEALTLLADARAAAADRVAKAKAEAAAFTALVRAHAASPAERRAALFNLSLQEMRGILGRMHLRTVTEGGVDQTIVFPPAKE